MTASLAANLVPVDFWANDTLVGRIVMALLVGLIGGGFVGLLQSRVLSRQAGGGGWPAWWLVSAVAVGLGNVASALVWQLLFNPVMGSRNSLVLATFCYSFADNVLVAVLTGIPLARMLSRRCAPQA